MSIILFMNHILSERNDDKGTGEVFVKDWTADTHQSIHLDENLMLKCVVPVHELIYSYIEYIFLCLINFSSSLVFIWNYGLFWFYFYRKDFGFIYFEGRIKVCTVIDHLPS